LLELHGGSASTILGRDRDTNACYANDDQLQAVTHIMTHRSEYFAGKTESSVAVNAEADTTAGGWAIVYEQMALVDADGTEYPLYTGQSSLRAGRRSAWKLGRTIDNDIAVIIAALRGRASSETSIGRRHDVIISFAAMQALNTLHYLFATVRGLARLQM
jgi:hypothetical protein